MQHPGYLCAIAHDRRRHFLFERRPVGDSPAGGNLTCFGGGRRDGEHSVRALLRELDEELAWRPQRFQPAIDLWIQGRWIARFYEAPLVTWPRGQRPGLGDLIAVLPAQQLSHPRVSPWHRAVLKHWLMGRKRVDLEQ